MTSKSYTLNITVGNPDTDVDLAMREAVCWLSERLDATGQHPVAIQLLRTDGAFVTQHCHDPQEEE